MSTATILIGLGAFLACAVEMVEALTIVLGVGVVRGWRSTLIGVGAATLVLGGARRGARPGAAADPDRRAAARRRRAAARLRPAVAAQGDPPRQRLQGAARRGRGVPARARARPRRPGASERAGLDWYSFTVAFKGVLLEGLEVVFIVITLRQRAGHGSAWRPSAPAAAVVVVVVAGVLGARPARARAREHDQVRRRPAADELRLLLGRRGRGRRLARRRALAARCDRLLRRRSRSRSCGRCGGSGRAALRRGRRHEIRSARSAVSGGTSSSATTGASRPGVAVALGAPAILVDPGVNAWWLLPARRRAADRDLGLAPDAAGLAS